MTLYTTFGTGSDIYFYDNPLGGFTCVNKEPRPSHGHSTMYITSDVAEAVEHLNKHAKNGAVIVDLNGIVTMIINKTILRATDG